MPWTRQIALAATVAATCLTLGLPAPPAEAMLADGGGGGGRHAIDEPRPGKPSKRRAHDDHRSGSRPRSRGRARPVGHTRPEPKPTRAGPKPAPAEPSPGMRRLMAHEPELRTRRTGEGQTPPRGRSQSESARRRGGEGGEGGRVRPSPARPSRASFEFDDPQDRARGRVRVGLFIAAERAGVCLLGDHGCIMGEGNDRGFQRHFSPLRTKGYVEIDFRRDRISVLATPTCDPSGGCNDAKPIGDGSFGDWDNEVEASDHVTTVPDPRPGPPPPGVVLPEPEPVPENETIRVSWELSNARLPGPFAGPSIDGTLELTPRADGSLGLRMSGDSYPSWEAYHDDGCGRTRTLIRERETSITDLWPLVGERSAAARVPPERPCGAARRDPGASRARAP